jgi:excisionase family DNA binding protein
MKRSSSDTAPVLTLKELSRYLKVNPSTVYRLIKGGKIPAFKVGSDWRFDREEIDRWRFER